MTEEQRIGEWEHLWRLTQTDETRIRILVDLRGKSKTGDRVARKALERLLTKFLE